MNATDLIEQYKAAKGLTSDYAAAKALGISQPAVSKIKNGGGLDSQTVAKIAQALGVPWAPLWEQLQADDAERKGDVERAAFWRGLGRAAMIGAVILSGVVMPNSAEASETCGLNANSLCIHYAQLRRYLAQIAKTLLRWAKQQKAQPHILPCTTSAA